MHQAYATEVLNSYVNNLNRFECVSAPPLSNSLSCYLSIQLQADLVLNLECTVDSAFKWKETFSAEEYVLSQIGGPFSSSLGIYYKVALQWSQQVIARYYINISIVYNCILYSIQLGFFMIAYSLHGSIDYREVLMIGLVPICNGFVGTLYKCVPNRLNRVHLLVDSNHLKSK